MKNKSRTKKDSTKHEIKELIAVSKNDTFKRSVPTKSKKNATPK